MLDFIARWSLLAIFAGGGMVAIGFVIASIRYQVRINREYRSRQLRREVRENVARQSREERRFDRILDDIGWSESREVVKH